MGRLQGGTGDQGNQTAGVEKAGCSGELEVHRTGEQRAKWPLGPHHSSVGDEFKITSH